MDRQQLDRIIDVASEILAPGGLECIEAEWVAGTKTLRVFIDRNAPQIALGIDLDGCVKANRLLCDNPRLDSYVPVADGDYTLEVSSPGIERPLRRRDHFKRHIGETIQVKLSEKQMDRRQGVGKLVGVSDDEQITLETTAGAWSFPIQAVQRAHLLYNWMGEARPQV